MDRARSTHIPEATQNNHRTVEFRSYVLDVSGKKRTHILFPEMTHRYAAAELLPHEIRYVSRRGRWGRDLTMKRPIWLVV
jgi:hypothetical protein